jgi:hypothetical protein
MDTASGEHIATQHAQQHTRHTATRAHVTLDTTQKAPYRHRIEGEQEKGQQVSPLAFVVVQVVASLYFLLPSRIA